VWCCVLLRLVWCVVEVVRWCGVVWSEVVRCCVV